MKIFFECFRRRHARVSRFRGSLVLVLRVWDARISEAWCTSPEEAIEI